MKTEESDDAWQADWRERVLERVRGQGFSTFQDFLAKHPNVPYSKLANLLGPRDIAAVQLERMHADLATTDDVRKSVMRDSLSRYLNEALKKGWGKGPYWESRVTGALANWIVMWDQQPWMRHVFTHLSQVAPVGWRPDGPTDAVIVKAIERAAAGNSAAI